MKKFFLPQFIFSFIQIFHTVHIYKRAIYIKNFAYLNNIINQ